MNQGFPACRVAGELVSMAGLRGRSVYDRTGLRVGRLVDLVVQLDTEDRHPPIQGAVVRARGRLRYVPEAAIVGIRHWNLYLGTVGVTPRTVPVNDHLVRLTHHVLHCRPASVPTPVGISDIILACTPDGVRLVGIDLSIRTLLRRLAPSPIRRTVAPHRVHHWPPLRGRPATAPPPTRPAMPAWAFGISGFDRTPSAQR
ncbi:MAG TPA: PRC-barrel domain-containing protein [Kribbella sp.]|nr:PRC-barrel domain-containing protein [Kribbella sp.]